MWTSPGIITIPEGSFFLKQPSHIGIFARVLVNKMVSVF